VLSGELFIRPVYAPTGAVLAEEMSPARMVTPRAVTVQAVEGVQRMVRKTGHVIQKRGVRGLLHEAILYIRWQLFYKQSKA
jgi:hypothetical protein